MTRPESGKDASANLSFGSAPHDCDADAPRDFRLLEAQPILSRTLARIFRFRLELVLIIVLGVRALGSGITKLRWLIGTRRPTPKLRTRPSLITVTSISPGTGRPTPKSRHCCS